jgi:hypothetical protein
MNEEGETGIDRLITPSPHMFCGERVGVRGSQLTIYEPRREAFDSKVKRTKI